ncbi:aldose 1-epimerase family protein [Spirosoma daeguense]
MITLENDFLRVSIRSKGAELTSLFHKPSGIEHLWQADPTVWGWHAPNLFPVVGGCLNNEVHIDGKTYPMERHGFARQSVFEVTESTALHAIFSLRSSEATRTHFPYEFEFQIIYELEAERLSITYRVVNQDEKTIFFSVGAHPAFTVPFVADETYENYYLQFEAKEHLETHRLSSGGFFTGETKAVQTENNDTSRSQLRLTKHLFDQDALVFKNLTSRSIVLRSDKNEHAVTVNFSDFLYLGVWAKPGASFVCIEPWLGCADSEGKTTPFEEKEAIQQLDAGNVFEAYFSIAIT